MKYLFANDIFIRTYYIYSPTAYLSSHNIFSHNILILLYHNYSPIKTYLLFHMTSLLLELKPAPLNNLSSLIWKINFSHIMNSLLYKKGFIVKVSLNRWTVLHNKLGTTWHWPGRLSAVVEWGTSPQQWRQRTCVKCGSGSCNRGYRLEIAEKW